MKRESHRFCDSTVQRFNGFAILLCALIFSPFARAQFLPAEAGSAVSISGQFIVVGSAENSPLANSPQSTNADFVRLKPALLAVSSERIKESLWRELGVSSKASWRGRIFIALHPARSFDEDVTIVSKPSVNGWDYQIQLPDVLPRDRFTRAMTGVLLLEFANRNARHGAPAVRIPAWLADGLSQELLAEGLSEIILSSPYRIVNGVPVAHINSSERGTDSLTDARRVLKNSSALTFEELSWPTDSQLNGADGGVYHASAQLFVNELLGLKNGSASLRAMLETLPRFYNWQSAFQSAFRENFPRPLDLEKWWALRVVNFMARDPGPRWTPAVSREKLDAILSVPVEFRTASNNLPVHAEVSLQAVIRNFDSARQTAILQTKLRDLELAQYRMAAPLAALTDAYRRVIADYLGQGKKTGTVRSTTRHSQAASQKVDAGDTLKKLDALDARRRTVESAIQPDNSMQPSLSPLKF
jgi:hypothetical protein